MNNALDISPGQRKELLGLIRRYLPNVEVWAFGSRVKWTARSNSDLDLVAFAKSEDEGRVARLKEALEESSLPFRVDLLVWNHIPENFKKNIQERYIILVDVQKVVRGRGVASNFVPFTELLSAIIDNRGRTCPVGSAGIPLIATNCVSNDTLYPSYDTTRYVDEETYKNWFRGHPEPGDIIFVCKGSPGRTNLVPSPVDFCIAQDMVAVRADHKKVNPKYLFAVLRSSIVQRQIDNMHVGTLIPHFKKGDFDKLLIPLMDEKEQAQIGELYFEMSRKIDLNRRINKTLDAMAQAIFKSWFVDFDPVKAKIAALAEGRDPLRAAISAISGKTAAELDMLPPEAFEQLAATAALFPDEMEESELGEIPRGWQASTLGEQCVYLNRGISPKYIDEGGVLVLNQKCIRDFSLDLSKARRHDLTQRSVSGRELQLGDVLVNSTGVGTLGRVAQVHRLDEPTIVDSHVTVARSGSKLNSEYLGQWFVTKQPGIEAMGEGSTGQTELSRGKLASMSILVPELAVLGAFADALTPMQSLIATQHQESRGLQEIRDALLPRLLSGELQPTVALEGAEA